MNKRLNLYEIMDIIEYANNDAGDALFKMLVINKTLSILGYRTRFTRNEKGRIIRGGEE